MQYKLISEQKDKNGDKENKEGEAGWASTAYLECLKNFVESATFFVDFYGQVVEFVKNGVFYNFAMLDKSFENLEHKVTDGQSEKKEDSQI